MQAEPDRSDKLFMELNTYREDLYLMSPTKLSTLLTAAVAAVIACIVIFVSVPSAKSAEWGGTDRTWSEHFSEEDIAHGWSGSCPWTIDKNGL